MIARVLSVRLAERPRPPLLFSEARYHGIGEAIARGEAAPAAKPPAVPRPRTAVRPR